jgi:hypothetical protein
MDRLEMCGAVRTRTEAAVMTTASPRLAAPARPCADDCVGATNSAAASSAQHILDDMATDRGME